MQPTTGGNGLMQSSAPSEEVLWSYLVQLISGLRAAHCANLICHAACLAPSKASLSPPPLNLFPFWQAQVQGLLLRPQTGCHRMMMLSSWHAFKVVTPDCPACELYRKGRTTSISVSRHLETTAALGIILSDVYIKLHFKALEQRRHRILLQHYLRSVLCGRI